MEKESPFSNCLIFKSSNYQIIKSLNPLRYFIVNKPVGMLSQFICSEPRTLLANLEYDFPEGIHAVGRLDKDSEGLLILTTDKSITRRLFDPNKKHPRTYCVQVYNTMTDAELDQLRKGITIEIQNKEKYLARPQSVQLVSDPPHWEDPFALNPYMQTNWLSITLNEGKFHQVRKMVKAMHHPCRRLIRTSIVELALGNLQPGQVRELEQTDFFALLHLDDLK